MSGWSTYKGRAVALPLENVDTDQLIPARFMSAPRSEGYGGFLLHDLREDDAAFPLDRVPGATVLVAGRNFGCGSSREAAVYALVDAGFRAVIAPSFGDIFASNAVNNGLLPAALPAEVVTQWTQALGSAPQEAHIDLDAGRITIAGKTHPFTLDATWRLKLINGWDDIDLTASQSAAIDAFAADRRDSYPWAWPTT